MNVPIVLAAAAAVASQSTITLDLNGDGKPDTVRLSQTSSSVTVRITYGGAARSPQEFHFSVDSGAEDGLCRLPAHLAAESTNRSKTHEGFALVDEACDSFHFYWDASAKRVYWWRL